MIQQLKNLFHKGETLFWNGYYRFPAKGITIIGVTGTDGKTTTSTTLHSILTRAGIRAGLITTVEAKIGEKLFDTGLHTTTPSGKELLKLIHYAHTQGCTHMIIETTSHAIDQGRNFMIPYTYCVLTNITPEHLDYHKTFEQYLLTKVTLLKKAKIVVLNKDDASYTRVAEELATHTPPAVTYSLQADSISPLGQLIQTNFQDIPTYNMYNFLAAATVCKMIGVSDEIVIEALSKLVLPKGRLEKIVDKGRIVYNDFAHTPNSLTNVLEFIRKENPHAHIIHVFGCAGKRDAYKRPVMGYVSNQYATETILTEEDYRTESFNDICNSIQSGMQRVPERIQDRAQAIEAAITRSKPGDIIVCTGKGHEQSLARGEKEYPWDERAIIEHALQKLS